MKLKIAYILIPMFLLTSCSGLGSSHTKAYMSGFQYGKSAKGAGKYVAAVKSFLSKTTGIGSTERNSISTSKIFCQGGWSIYEISEGTKVLSADMRDFMKGCEDGTNK